ncbi:MAG: prolyl oligopeptidase family serine peptidase [Terriglobia bacterium]
MAVSSLRACARIFACLALAGSLSIALAQTNGLQSHDLYKFRSVGEVALSPDGQRVAYAMIMTDQPGRPYSQLWIMDLASGKSIRLNGEKSSNPVWSPDGKWLAYDGSEGNRSGLMIVHPDGSDATFLAPVETTNAPLPGRGASIAWSPASDRIAFVSATPGPETAAMSGDPMVITRYMYRPTASEGLDPFNDNRRLHIFLVDLRTKQVRQLTHGIHYEHSIDWSPDGKEILFVSNHEPNSDEFFNYDLFALNVSDGSIRRLTATEGCEYTPRWSPDGSKVVYLATKRGLTDRETNMEDTHVWLMNPNGSNRREIGAVVDDRQGDVGWARDGRAVYFTVQKRGSVLLYKLPVAGGPPQVVVNGPGRVVSWSAANNGDVIYSFTSPRDMAEMFMKTSEGTKHLTNLNARVLEGKQIAQVEPFTFISNDNKYLVEGFLTKPLNLTPGSKHPLIVDIHGGPHGQNGPEFNFLAQCYAAHGWATLNVNYRGSTGYGQKFADAVFGDQDGNEGEDVLYGVSAAVRRNLWIDRDRMGIEGVSYGGQLTDWLITQTNEFKAAIPVAGIVNLISYNYLTYYNQYEEMEFGKFLQQDDLMNFSWERSALKHVANVHTPTMLLHGSNDPDVPTEEAEQYYVALKDVGVETILVIYPREGHGLREVRHQVDRIDRSIAWYEKHFPPPGTGVKTNVQP